MPPRRWARPATEGAPRRSHCLRCPPGLSALRSAGRPPWMPTSSRRASSECESEVDDVVPVRWYPLESKLLVLALRAAHRESERVRQIRPAVLFPDSCPRTKGPQPRQLEHIPATESEEWQAGKPEEDREHRPHEPPIPWQGAVAGLHQGADALRAPPCRPTSGTRPRSGNDVICGPNADVFRHKSDSATTTPASSGRSRPASDNETYRPPGRSRKPAAEAGGTSDEGRVPMQETRPSAVRCGERSEAATISTPAGCARCGRCSRASSDLRRRTRTEPR